MALDPHSPVVVSGVGGSGTRVVSEILMRLGYHLGTDNNSAHDNLWFRFLLKRPEWLARCRRENPQEIHRALDLLTGLLTGAFHPGRADWAFILAAAREQGWRGAKRFLRLLRAQGRAPASATGWGWKEPSVHVLLEELFAHYPRMKYIHAMRHGLDMAFTGKLSQIRDWAELYGVAASPDEKDLPRVLLDYWIRANRQALEACARAGGGRFHVLDFDRLCAQPRSEVERLVQFLGCTAPESLLDACAAIPRLPKSTGRYKEHDLGLFSGEQLAAVRELGFPVEGR